MDGLYVERGLCSDRTKELLRDQETCVIPMWSQKYNIYYTTVELIRSMCENQTLQDFRPAPLERRSEKRQSKSSEPLQRSQQEHFSYADAADVRLIPIDKVWGENFD